MLSRTSNTSIILINNLYFYYISTFAHFYNNLPAQEQLEESVDIIEAQKEANRNLEDNVASLARIGTESRSGESRKVRSL